MLDHMILTVSNVQRSLAFYEAALKPLNISFFLPYEGQGSHPDLWGFGYGKRAFFWITQGKPDPMSIHWGFMAENNDKVDEFYRAAMSAGARDNILTSLAFMDYLERWRFTSRATLVVIAQMHFQGFSHFAIHVRQRSPS